MTMVGKRFDVVRRTYWRKHNYETLFLLLLRFRRGIAFLRL